MEQEIIHKVVKDFIFNNRRCLVVLVNRKIPKFNNHLDEWSKLIQPYHNGYIEIKNYEEHIDIYTEEKTYCGNLDFDGLKILNNKLFIGFDTMHYYNFENPKTQSAESVELKCKKIVEELEQIDLWIKIKYWFKYHFSIIKSIIIGKVNG